MVQITANDNRKALQSRDCRAFLYSLRYFGIILLLVKRWSNKLKLILPSKIKKETVPKITHEVFDNKLHPKYDNFELDLSDVDYIEQI